MFALIEEPQRGWGDPVILVSLIGGIVLFAAFVLWESRAPQPMLPLRLFRRRNFSFANLETLTVYAGLSTLTFFLVLFLQQLAGYTALRSGLALLPITVVMFVLSPRVGRLSMRYGPRLFMGVGPLIAGLALIGVIRLKPGFSYWSELLPSLLVFSVGLSMIVAPLTATVLADAGESDAGIASGVEQRVARVAGLLGIAVVGAAVAGPQNTARPVRASTWRWRSPRCSSLAGGVIGIAGIRNRHELDTRLRRSSSTTSRSATRAATRRRSTTSRSRSRPATFCVLVGPSGGGKTTALKMVNRLIPFDSGDIRIDGRSIRDLPADRVAARASAT